MRYTNEDFIRLMTEIEDQGGEHLDEVCGGQEYEFQMKDGRTRTHFSPGCENEGLFNVRYSAYETVRVPEPVLEPDPDRDGKSKRQKTTLDPTDPKGKRKIGVTKTVKRKIKEPIGGLPEFHEVRVCAYDDNVGAWPRFARVIQDEGTR